MAYKQKFYPESKFGNFTDIDGTIAFYARVNSLLDPSFKVLDFGCGRGAGGEDNISFRKNLRILKGKVNKVIGIDVDKNAQTNPHIDEFHLLNSEKLPLNENSVNICVCDNVLEHIQNPSYFFSEVYRVLIDGGYLCIRTPNSWNYVAIVSKLIPERFHTAILHKAQEKRKDEDVFPAYYRCNSIPKLKAILSQHNFDHAVYGYEAEPSYLSFSKIAYWGGVMHQRFAPGFLKASIFAFARINKK